ncbi:MAG: hypothetical protein AAF539_12270 [Planctomycetota bacterium]
MNLPVSPLSIASVAATAVRMVSNAVSDVKPDFASVLSESSDPITTDNVTRQMIDWLTDQGFQLNDLALGGAIQWELNDHGQPIVAYDHPSAAALELSIRDSPELERSLASWLRDQPGQRGSLLLA